MYISQKNQVTERDVLVFAWMVGRVGGVRKEQRQRKEEERGKKSERDE